jgi:hypothetical protein
MSAYLQIYRLERVHGVTRAPDGPVYKSDLKVLSSEMDPAEIRLI